VAGLDFSFSGLKTSLLYRLRDLGDDPPKADLAASYQHAIVEALALRVERAIEQTGLRRVALGGGVAANTALRARIEALDGVAGLRPVTVHVPPRELCTDNAAMIASAARYTAPLAHPAYLALDAYPTA
jgi:N6-L-threonylcarbamoyladenine synthase